MNKNLRKAIIAGNWKMNKNRAEAKTLIEELKPLVANAGCEVVDGLYPAPSFFIWIAPSSI